MFSCCVSAILCSANTMATTVKYFNDSTWMCIIRCARSHYKILWAGLTLLTSLNGTPAIVRILHVGGMTTSMYGRLLVTVLKLFARETAVNLVGGTVFCFVVLLFFPPNVLGTIKSCQVHAIEHNMNLLRLLRSQQSAEVKQLDAALLAANEDEGAIDSDDGHG